jgi:SAM-dependent methyltransferase
MPQCVTPQEIFGTQYPYFSSYSDSWLRHAKTFAHHMISRWRLSPHSRVIEVGSNDGYLLQYFVAAGIPALGVDPVAAVAEAALAKGVRTMRAFFGQETASDLLLDGIQGDLLVANNVFPHVPDVNDFLAGLRMVLKPGGVLTMEFPYVVRLLEGVQFDTIYHEHLSYFSFRNVERMAAAHDLTVFDVEQLRSHGGSLRVYICHADDNTKPSNGAVQLLRAEEETAGLNGLRYYESFKGRVHGAKHALLDFLINARKARKSIVGYGAPGKGNTLLNFCGIRTDFLDYLVDRNPVKHGKFTPGTHIPIHPIERISATKPHYLLILPWNLAKEIREQMHYVREWGGQFVVPIPTVQVG